MVSAGLELLGPICGTRAGTVAACAIAMELAEVRAPRMQSAPLAMSLRAALTPPSGVVPSSAYSICSLTSRTPAWRRARFACCTARPAAFAYAGPNTADAPVKGTTTPIRSVKPRCSAAPRALVEPATAARSAVKATAAAPLTTFLRMECPPVSARPW